MDSAANLDDVLRCVAEMAEPARRIAAARSLANRLGADDLIIFVRDPVVGRSLPAPGFPQTLQGGRQWRDLVERSVAEGSAEGTVIAPDGQSKQASAVGRADGSALVLIGGTPHRDAVVPVVTLLPFLSALFVSEALAHRSAADSILARQSAAQSSELAAKLDTTRSELQNALAVAETATRARDEFLATVSHELRTPLTSIIGWIQLLRGETDVALRSEGFDTIERNARAQGRLIEDILDFSRINAGKLRLDVRPVELLDVVNAALEVVRPAADARSVKLSAVLDPNAGLIAGDPDRLQQVVWNLLSNAVKFTPRGGAVQVRLERISSHAELTVSDNGEGIAPAFLPSVFDRFSQADSSSSRRHGGLGLGLGIVKQLVELHGGTVQAFSPGLGKGSTFAVRLPLLVAHQLPLPAAVRPRVPDWPIDAPAPEALADLTGVSILVVEDNEDARTLLATIFRRSGAVVQTAENVAEALRILKGRRPDIMISDIEMPGEDGYSLIRRVRLEEPENNRMPAIALTAYTRGVDRKRALDAGFQTHMAKPVEPGELVAAVKSLLSTTTSKQVS